MKKLLKFEEKMRKVELLPTRDCEAGYGPAKKEYQIDMHCTLGYLNINMTI